MQLDQKKYQVSAGIHNDTEVIWVKFPKDDALIRQFRAAFPNARWSASQKCWYLPDHPVFRKKLALPAKESGKVVLAKIHPVNQQRRKWGDIYGDLSQIPARGNE